MADGDFNDLPRRTDSDKVLHDKAFNITKKTKFNSYHRSKVFWGCWYKWMCMLLIAELFRTSVLRS